MIKNKAFTMSEALIVLGIVAVLAALSVVAITNSKPDENITLFRRAYSTTAKIVQDMMNDRDLYPNAETNKIEESTLGSVANSVGLFDSSFSDDIKSKYPYLSCEGESCPFGKKFIETFMHKANALSSDIKSYSRNGLAGSKSVTEGSMTTPDGIYWNIIVKNKTDREHHISTNTITVNTYMNGEDTTKSCSYNAATCPYPTRFAFNIDRNGKITPQDPMACSYLRYPKAVRNSQIPTDQSVNNCFNINFNNSDDDDD